MPSQNLVAVIGQSFVELGPWRLAHWALAAAVLAATVWVMFGRPRHRLNDDRELAWLLWHWHTGGRLETSKQYPCEEIHKGRCYVRRALVGAARSTAAAAVVAAEYVRSGGGGNPVVWGYAGAVAASVVAVVLMHAAVRAAIHVWWVRPIHRAVYKLCGWEHKGQATRRAFRYIRFRTRTGDRLDVRIRVAPDFDLADTNKVKVVRAVEIVGDLGEVDHEWRNAGRKSSVVFRPAKRLPALVPFTDRKVKRLMEGSAPSAPFLGLGRDGAEIAYDLDSDAPHLLVSAATGGGKSSIVRTAAAQLMWHGAELVNLDVKRHSQIWTRGLDHVTDVYEIDKINAALVELGADAAARNRQCDHLRAGDPFPPFTRTVIICEELNGTMTMLQEWWKDTGHRGSACPGVVALRSILFMGRAVRVNVLAVAQQATARALGGGEARENFAVRILSDYSANTWKMLAPQCDYIPADSHTGRAVAIHGRQALEVQLAHGEDEEIHHWLAHRQGIIPATSSPTVTPIAELDPVNATVQPGYSDQSVGSDPESDPEAVLRFVTLAEAVSDRLVTCSHNALKMARKNDPAFPKSVKPGEGRYAADLYWDQAIIRWEATRPRRGKSSQSHDPIVYFIVAGGRPVYGGQVKIGWTTNLIQRLDSFAMEQNDVVKTVGDDTRKSRESAFHERWKRERIYPDREWFHIRGELATFLGVRQEATR